MVSLVNGFRISGGRTSLPVSRAILSGANVVWLELGDSKVGQKGTVRWEEVLLQAGVGIPWGGCRQELQGVSRAGKYVSNSAPLITGDAATALAGTLIGHTAQDYFPGDAMRFVDTLAADPANTWFAYYVDKWKQSRLPLLWARAHAMGSTQATAHFPVIGAITPSSGLHATWAVDRFSTSGMSYSAQYNPVADEFHVLSHAGAVDYSGETNKCPTMVHTPGVPMTVGTLAYDFPVVTACDGVRVISWSVPGRSIAGWADPEILTDHHLSVQVPALKAALGAEMVIPVISLGTNYPADILAAGSFSERVELHKGYLASLVSRWRALTGEHLVAVTTSYVDPAEKDLPDSYFAVGAREFAAEFPDVQLIDTSSRMGRWYEMQAAGLLEGDGLHLNDTGRLALAAAYSDELVAGL